MVRLFGNTGIHFDNLCVCVGQSSYSLLGDLLVEIIAEQ